MAPKNFKKSVQPVFLCTLTQIKSVFCSKLACTLSTSLSVLVVNIELSTFKYNACWASTTEKMKRYYIIGGSKRNIENSFYLTVRLHAGV